MFERLAIIRIAREMFSGGNGDGSEDDKVAEGESGGDCLRLCFISLR